MALLLVLFERCTVELLLVLFERCTVEALPLLLVLAAVCLEPLFMEVFVLTALVLRPFVVTPDLDLVAAVRV